MIAISVLLLPLLALAAAWLWWGRPLAAARREAADLRVAVAAADAEAAARRREADESAPYRVQAVQFGAELAALKASLSERQSAFEAALAERDRVHAAHLAQTDAQFQRLAAQALDHAQARFAEQAEATLKLHRAEAAKGLADSRVALADLVRPMHETLGRYETELKAIEAKRVEAYGGLSEQLAAVAQGQHAVRMEAGKIVSALRSSAKASGAWGEAQLRNVLEMAGLRLDIDFELQASTTDTDGNRRRPDAVLRLPGGRQLVIDSKCSLGDYLTASEHSDEEQRKAALRRHATAVRDHAKGLGERAYWKEFAASADFVVMFLPGENFLSAALEHDLDLLSWALDRRILLAGPTNLLAIARIVAMVWRQETMAEEARAIGEQGAQLYAALATMTEHVGRVGRNIGDAATAYNEFIGSLESNVLPKARRFTELGVDPGKKVLGTPAPVERTLRQVPAEMLRLNRPV